MSIQNLKMRYAIFFLIFRSKTRKGRAQEGRLVEFFIAEEHASSPESTDVFTSQKSKLIVWGKYKDSLKMDVFGSCWIAYRLVEKIRREDTQAG